MSEAKVQPGEWRPLASRVAFVVERGGNSARRRMSRLLGIAAADAALPAGREAR